MGEIQQNHSSIGIYLYLWGLMYISITIYATTGFIKLSFNPPITQSPNPSIPKSFNSGFIQFHRP